MEDSSLRLLLLFPALLPNVVVLTFFLAAFVLCLLKRRARAYAARLASRVRKMVKEGPMIDISDGSEAPQRILGTSMRRACELLIPRHAKALSCQVGGISDTKKPVLEVGPSYVFKPLHMDHRGYREVAFYEACKTSRETLYSNNNSDAATTMGALFGRSYSLVAVLDALAKRVALGLGDPVVTTSEHEVARCNSQKKREVQLLCSLSKFIPEYYGVVGPAVERIVDNHNVVLHNITARFRKPCVMDIKMGSQTYEPDASKEKQHRESAKYPHQGVFGFRIVGMRLYDPLHADSEPDGFRVFRKEFGPQLTTHESLLEAFECFFRSGTSPRLQTENRGTSQCCTYRIIDNFLTELRSLAAWFDQNETFCFYSSSILLVYEGDCNNGENVVKPELKLIDFGHVRREYGGDNGYRLGLQNLEKIFGQLLEQEKNPNSAVDK